MHTYIHIYIYTNGLCVCVVLASPPSFLILLPSFLPSCLLACLPACLPFFPPTPPFPSPPTTVVCGSVTTSGKVAITIAPVLMALFMLFGGFFINAGSVPAYYAWIKYISLFNYLNGAIQKSELEGLVFENGMTGEDVLASLHLMPLTVWQNLSVILGMVLGFRVLAFVFVRRNFTPKPFALPADAAAQAHGKDAGKQQQQQQQQQQEVDGAQSAV
jgi:hypothetical protein